MIENPDLHHRNETLTGPGDPWLYGRAATTWRGGVLVGARLGATIPLGRTVEDPFVLGDMGIAHEHSQFGTGTFGAIAGIEAARDVRSVHLDAAALTIQTFYENRHGYTAGDRYALSFGAGSALGTAHWRFRATLDSVWETAETWNGVVHTDDGNVGRTDVLAGLSATWLVTDDWHAGVDLKVPAYTHIEGGQLDALGFLGVSVGTHVHLFEEKHAHHHEPIPPSDWTGLDKQDISRDGSAVPLVPVPGKLTVFDFWATWCEPCKTLDHELAELARRHPDAIAIRKLDVVDTDSPASRQYVGAATLPHVKVYGRDGKLLFARSAPPLQLLADIEAALAPAAVKPAPKPTGRRIAITVTDRGFEPASITIDRNEPVTLVFTRKSTKTCATDVHMALPDGARVDQQLPLDQPVAIPLRVTKPGELTYACGMDMVKGSISVR